MSKHISRRKFLTQTGLIGCSLAASPLVTPVSFAAAPGENRLVVIILRGAMDGLDVLRPWGDAHFASHRPTLAATREDPLQISEFQGVHPGIKPLLPLWARGELSFVQATSTPYRDKRSHFDGQDILEAGTVGLAPASQRDGWLNRLLPALGNGDARTAFALGREDMLVLRGDAPVSNWSPDVDLTLSSAGLRLLERVMAADPAMAASMQEAIGLAASDGDAVAMDMSGAMAQEDMMESMAEDIANARRGKTHLKIADFAAEQLLQDTRIASFSIGGWDTHAAQNNTLNRPLASLSETILRLRDALGTSVWGKTTILCMTEFGRTVRENGSRGTDHGTGGTMILAGGAVRGGKVHGDWPGLAEADLYDRRDLMPTSDVRAWAGWAIQESFGIPQSTLEQTVFGGLDMGARPKLLL